MIKKLFSLILLLIFSLNILSIDVFVRTASGKIIMLNLKNDDTVENIKNKIHEKEGVPVDQQFLSLDKIKIEEKYSVVSDYPINQGSTLNLTIKQKQVSNLKIDSISDNSFKLKFTKGNGNGRIVLISKGDSPKAFPKKKTTYTGDNEFANGSKLDNTSWYCAHVGNDTIVHVSGINPKIEKYSILALEYGGKIGQLVYDTSCNSNNYLVYTPQKINVEAENIVIYPNPAKDKLIVKHHFGKISFEIYSQDGVIALKGYLDEENNEINILNIKDGVYFLKVSNEKVNIQKKFMISK